MIEVSTTLFRWNGVRVRERGSKACLRVRTHTQTHTNECVNTNKQTFEHNESVHRVNKAHEKPSHYLSNSVVAFWLIFSLLLSHTLLACFSLSPFLSCSFNIFSVNRMSLHFHPSRSNIHTTQSSYFWWLFCFVCAVFSRARLIHSSCFDTFEESFWMTEQCVHYTFRKNKSLRCFLLFFFFRCKQVRVFCCAYVCVYKYLCVALNKRKVNECKRNGNQQSKTVILTESWFLLRTKTIQIKWPIKKENRASESQSNWSTQRKKIVKLLTEKRHFITKCKKKMPCLT